MALKDMAYTPAQAKEEAGEMTSPDMPKYPYGLCIDLNDESMTNLGMTALPGIGTEVMILAKAKVTSVSAYESEGSDAEKRVSFQITAMELGAAQDSGNAASKLYGDN